MRRWIIHVIEKKLRGVNNEDLWNIFIRKYSVALIIHLKWFSESHGGNASFIFKDTNTNNNFEKNTDRKSYLIINKTKNCSSSSFQNVAYISDYVKRFCNLYGINKLKCKCILVSEIYMFLLKIKKDDLYVNHTKIIKTLLVNRKQIYALRTSLIHYNLFFFTM